MNDAAYEPTNTKELVHLDALMRKPASPPIRRVRDIGKRTIDVTLSLALLALSSPVFLVVMCAVAAEGKPVFYSHKRIGRGGCSFGCLKFRTMRGDSDKVLQDFLARNQEARLEWDRTRKLRRDPRVTGIGKLLRKSSLDELPQLFNIIRGDMSLVGPRPVVASELDQFYGSCAASYCSIRPGLTGPWQVGGRNKIEYANRVEMDVAYANNYTIAGDLRILLKTFRVVLFGRGAY